MATNKRKKVDPDAVQVTHNAAKNDKGTVRNPIHDGGEQPDARFWAVPLGKDDKYDPKAPPRRVDDKIHRWALELRKAWSPLAVLDRTNDVLFENRVRTDQGWIRPVLEGLDVDEFIESVLFFSRSIVETFQARMVRRRPAPQFQIDDCEWSVKQKIRDAQAELDAELTSTDFASLYAMMIRDAGVRGDGVTVVGDDDDGVFHERAHRREFLVDPYEARQGADAVRTLYRVRAVSRDSLIARFPKFRKEIMQAPASTMAIDEVSTADMNVNAALLGARDLVDFVEAWHLRADEGCDDDKLDEMDGRHAGCLDGVTLWYRPWYEPSFPIARLTRHQPMEGFWGYGDIEILRNAQTIIDQMAHDIEANVAVTGKGVWITPPGVSADQLVGYRPFQLVAPTGAGARMEFYHPQPVGQGAIDLLGRLVGWLHDLTGAAQWSAQGKSPLGAGASAVAIDTMEELLSDRHSVFEQACSRYVCTVGELTIEAKRRVARRQKSGETARARKSVKWIDRRGSSMDWDSEDMRQGRYRLHAEPVSTMPHTRAGKLAWVGEMLAKGFLPSSAALGLIDEPDTRQYTKVFLAALRNCERMMEDLGDEKLPIPTPEEFHDIPTLLTYARAYYNMAQAARPQAPEAIQDRYRQFIDAVLTLQQDVAMKDAQQQAALAQAGGGAPGGAQAGAGGATWHGMPISRIPELAAKRAARQAQNPTTADVLTSRGLVTPSPAPMPAGPSTPMAGDQPAG